MSNKKVNSKKVSSKIKKEKVLFEQRPLLFKVSEKKAISIYGLNRFPVTLYKDQMLRLLDSSEQIRHFIEENNDKLASKKEKEEEKEEKKEEEKEEEKEKEDITKMETETEMEIKPF